MMLGQSPRLAARQQSSVAGVAQPLFHSRRTAFYANEWCIAKNGRPKARRLRILCAGSQGVPRGKQPLRGPPRVAPTFRVQLIEPTDVVDSEACDRLLVYLPGTDGTGQAILPQIPALRRLGYDVWCLYVPPDDRSDWEQLTTQVTLLLRQLLQHWRGAHDGACSLSAGDGDGWDGGSPVGSSPDGGGAAAGLDGVSPDDGGACAGRRVTIVAESFGCCLALRLAASGAGPELLDRLVLVNPATSFNRSLSGLSSLIAATNLLSLFPRDWYAVAQATLLPLLVDGERVEPANQRLLQSMVLMEPPRSAAAFGFGAGSGSGSSTEACSSSSPSSAAAAGASTSGSGSALWEGATSSGERSGGGASSGSGGGTLYYGPAAAANFRANLLRDGDPGEEALRRVGVPVLLVTSARDRLLPSILEGARLERLLPAARRVILPDSGHAALLERGVDLAEIMRAAGFAGLQRPRAGLDGAAAAAGSAGAGAGARAGTRPGRSRAGAATAAHAAAESRVALSTQVAPAPVAAVAAAGGDAWNLSSTEREAQASGNAPQTSPAYAAASRPAAGAAGNGSDTARSDVTDSGQPAQRLAGGRRREVGSAGGRSSAGDGGGGAEEDAKPADVDSAFDEWCQNLAPWRDVISPVVLGLEHLPPPGSTDFSRPMLFVGNHQKMGFYDTPLLVYELYVRGYRVRGLAHPGHWAGPFGRWFESFGAVKASPMAAFRLLRSGEKVLLFPGGAKEVVKRRGQEYTLLWKDSPDFVRLAARCNALIVPFAAVGADDAYDVIMDTEEVVEHPVLGPLTRGLLSRVSAELDPRESVFPITRLPVVGLPTPIPVPNLQRLYFRFAPPVDPRALRTDIRNPQQVQQLYDGVKDTVTQCMSELLAVRAADGESQLGARLSRSLQRMVPVLGAAAQPQPQQQQQQ